MSDAVAPDEAADRYNRPAGNAFLGSCQGRAGILARVEAVTQDGCRMWKVGRQELFQSPLDLIGTLFQLQVFETVGSSRCKAGPVKSVPSPA